MTDSQCNQICEGQFGKWLRAKSPREGGKLGGRLEVTEGEQRRL